MKKKTLREICRFAMVGGIGFAVDGGVLTYLANQEGFDVYLSRGVSFPSATLVTWALNRSFTFRLGKTKTTARERIREYARYFLVQSVGALINLAVFAGLLFGYPEFERNPIVPLATGSIVAMFFNFASSKSFAFRRRACLEVS